MMFSRDLRDAVARGEVTVSIRMWTRPQVKVGGRYHVAGVIIEIDSLEVLPFSAVTDDDVAASGDTDREALRARAAHAGPIHDDTLVHRVEFHVARLCGVGARGVAAPECEVVGPRLDDAEELASVHVRAWREAYGGLLPERFYDDVAREARQVMWSGLLAEEDAGERVRVARREGRIVGFVARGPAAEHLGHPPERDEQLYALYVLSSCYGLGVGQALLDQALCERPAQLWVAKDNARARRFYEKNGFTADGTEQVDPDLDGLVEIRMVR